MKRNPIHSFPGALAVGVLLAAVALTCAVVAGVAGNPMRAEGDRFQVMRF